MGNSPEAEAPADIVVPEIPLCACAGCGLLNAYEKGDTGALQRNELGLVFRLEGGDAVPACSIPKFDLAIEGRNIEKRNSLLTTTQITLEIISTPRRCSEYMEYQRGDTPQEHMRRREDMRLENERRAHDLKLAGMTLRSQESLQAVMSAHKEVTDKLAGIATRSEVADAKFQGTDTLFKWLFGILAFLTLLVGALPLWDRVTGRETPVRVDVTITVPQSTPSSVGSPSQ